jgi:hypothetical protein
MRISRLKTASAMSLVLLLGFGQTPTISAQDDGKTDWMRDIDWAANDTGAPDCPWFYVTSDLQGCIALGLATANHSGNRSCVIDLAIAAAKSGIPQAQGVAYGYVLITQCHNPTERQNLVNAGDGQIIQYLQSFD